jgi:hypothetical protein
MALLIPVTQMNGVPVMVGMYGVKMIEESTYIPHPVDATMPAAKEGTAPATTQTVLPATAAAAVPPIVCSTITFHDDKTLVVKETMAVIAAMSGPVPHSV